MRRIGIYNTCAFCDLFGGITLQLNITSNRNQRILFRFISPCALGETTPTSDSIVQESSTHLYFLIL